MYSKARRMGIETAMMVTALSAVPKVNSFTLSTVLMLTHDQKTGNTRAELTCILTRDSTDTLDLQKGRNAGAVVMRSLLASCAYRSRMAAGRSRRTHKTPMLVAKRALSFSFLLMDASQTIIQGIEAKTISMTPEYAATKTL